MDYTQHCLRVMNRTFMTRKAVYVERMIRKTRGGALRHSSHKARRHTSTGSGE
jgi:hypothetical protein